MPQVGVNCSLFVLCSFAGDKLSLDGKHTLAMDAWKEQLKRFQGRGIFIMVVFFTSLYFSLWLHFGWGLCVGGGVGWGGVWWGGVG